MFRYFTSFILIGITIGVFFLFSDPLYKSIKDLKVQQATYDEALNNSKALENERDKLTAKYSTISPENLDKIKKFLPDGVDNIRLILEIEKIAAPYGMTLKDIQYNAAQKEEKEGASTISNEVNGRDQAAAANHFGSWDLGFSTTGTYSNFLNFMRDLESNLRIVDISAIQFSSASSSSGTSLSEVYRYTFSIKTYWLKN